MNNAGQTAVEQARSRFTAEFMRWQRSGYGSPDAAFERLVSAIRAADPRREAVETALAVFKREVVLTRDWLNELAGRGGAVDPQGLSDIAGDLNAALKAVEQASLSDTEEGGRA